MFRYTGAMQSAFIGFHIGEGSTLENLLEVRTLHVDFPNDGGQVR
jgi:hypothetical protein